uniref:Tc1-like transposase DDE domain-containing protein n=1 Tax=Octopus bimaculoides TaxID=37653 RepID=A0A0L8GVX8_OCTBM
MLKAVARKRGQEQSIGRLHAGQRPWVTANNLNCSIRTIERLRNDMNATNSMGDRPRSWQPTVTMERFRRAIESTRQTIGTRHRPIFTEKVCCRLRSCRRPARGPILTDRDRRSHLRWIQKRQNWRYQQWSLYSSLWKVDIAFLWQMSELWSGYSLEKGKRYVDGCAREKESGNAVTAARYIDVELRPHIVTYFTRHRNHVFQDDNARTHTASYRTDFLQQQNIHTLLWPARSPDFNSIEHLDKIQRRLIDTRPRFKEFISLDLGHTVITFHHVTSNMF